MFKKKQFTESDAEQDFRTILDIVKNYDRQGFNRLIDAIEDCWKGYDKILRTKTRDEKETDEITKVEKTLDFLEVKNERDKV